MKKETLITAVLFLGVGFLGGYAFSTHRGLTRQSAAAASTAIQSGDPGTQGAPASAQNGGAAASGTSDLSSQLPKGHPQLTDAEVIQFFKDASAHNPGNPAPRLKLADFLYDHKQYDEAISWYQQALAIDAKNVDARTDMATCYFSLGESREAIDQLQTALKYDPRHEPTLFNLAVVSLEGTHDFAQARSALNRLAAINPNYPGLADLQQQIAASVSAAKQPD